MHSTGHESNRQKRIPVKIAVNALSVQGGGGLTFLKNLLRHLLLIDKENEYLVLAVEAKIEALGIHNSYPNLRTLIYPSRGWIARGMWEQILLPWVMRRERVDILYAPGNQGPVLFCCPFVVFIQNVDPLIREFKGYPLCFLLKREISRFLMRVSVRRARKVIAVSEYTRQLIMRAFGYPQEKIAVIGHGFPEEADAPFPEGTTVLQEVRPREPYFLAVSTIKENKNYENLVQAFAAACARLPESMNLLIAGEAEDQGCFSRVNKLVQENGLNSRVCFLGDVDVGTLRALYREAAALVFPSKRESFGLPPLEAMAYGIPLAASRIEPIVEVCGDAACYFDPENNQEMAEAMVEIVKNTELRKTLIERGLVQAKLFSWEATARRTLAIFHVAVSAV